MTNHSNPTCAYKYETPTDHDYCEGITLDRPQFSACPHPVVDSDRDRCLFHFGDHSFPESQLSEEFEAVLTDPDRQANFAGGHLSGLELAGKTLSTPEGDPIDLRGVTIDGDLNLTDACIEVPLLLDNAAITGSIAADGAQFDAPVSLVNANIGRRIFMHEATVVGGIAASGLAASYVDTRSLHVEGPMTLDEAQFSAVVTMGRATIDGPLSAIGAHFERPVDCTGVTVAGTLDLSGGQFDDKFDLIAATLKRDVDMTGCIVENSFDVRHSDIGGDLHLSECEFGDEVTLDGVTCDGNEVVCSDAVFAGGLSGSNISLPTATATFDGSRFGGEAWFVYGTFGGPVSFARATFTEALHLRDATFERSLILSNMDSSSATYLHQATINGALDASEATFNHLQFSATAHGSVTFEGTDIDARGLFMRSEFGDNACFDYTSFAGNPDFTDTRFTGETSWEGTEFLVEPTFEGTRFAHEIDFSTASFPPDSARGLAEYRRDMILARPQDLRHIGETIPKIANPSDVSVPIGTDHLIQDQATLAKAVTSALAGLRHGEWYAEFGEGLQTARTAVAQIATADDVMIVYGLELSPDASSPDEFLDAAHLVCVYGKQDDNSYVLGHFAEGNLDDLDYLISVPANDSAFEAGASVATLGELRAATIRHQAFRAAGLVKQGGDGPHLNRLLVPVLTAASTLS